MIPYFLSHGSPRSVSVSSVIICVSAPKGPLRGGVRQTAVRQLDEKIFLFYSPLLLDTIHVYAKTKDT